MRQRFRPGRAPALWRPRHLADGLYLVRFAVPFRGGGQSIRRVAVARRAGRFHTLPAVERALPADRSACCGRSGPPSAGAARPRCA